MKTLNKFLKVLLVGISLFLCSSTSFATFTNSSKVEAKDEIGHAQERNQKNKQEELSGKGRKNLVAMGSLNNNSNKEEDLINEINQLKTINNQLQSDLDTANYENNMYFLENDTLTTESNHLKTLKIKLERDKKTLQDEIITKDETQIQRDNKANEIQGQLMVSEYQLRNIEIELTKSESKYDGYEAIMNNKLRDKNNELRVAKEQVQKEKDSITSLSNTIATMTQKAISNEKEISNAKKNTGTWKKRTFFASIIGMVSIVGVALMYIRNSLENDSLNGQIESQNNQIRSKNSQINDLENIVCTYQCPSSLTWEFSTNEATSADNSISIICSQPLQSFGNVTNEVEAPENLYTDSEYLTLKNKSDSQKAEIDSLNNELKAQKQNTINTISHLYTQELKDKLISTPSAKITILTKQVEDLLGQETEKDKKITELEAELKAELKAENKKLSEQRATIEALGTNDNTQQYRIADLKKQVKEFKDKVKTQETDNNKKVGDLTILNTQLEKNFNDSIDKVKTQDEEISKLKTKLQSNIDDTQKESGYKKYIPQVVLATILLTLAVWLAIAGEKIRSLKGIQNNRALDSKQPDSESNKNNDIISKLEKKIKSQEKEFSTTNESLKNELEKEKQNLEKEKQNGTSQTTKIRELESQLITMKTSSSTNSQKAVQLQKQAKLDIEKIKRLSTDNIKKDNLNKDLKINLQLQANKKKMLETENSSNNPKSYLPNNIFFIFVGCISSIVIYLIVDLGRSMFLNIEYSII